MSRLGDEMLLAPFLRRSQSTPTASARARALRECDASKLLAALVATDRDVATSIADTLLNERPVASYPGQYSRAVTEMANAIRYRTGASLAIRPDVGGSAYLISGASLLQALIERGEPMPKDPAMLEDPPAELLRSLQFGYPSCRQRTRKKAHRYGRMPVAVLSTAGNPTAIEAALLRHIANWADNDHLSPPVLVADDAPPSQCAEVDMALRRVKERFPDIRLVRFAEYLSDGSPGPKAVLRKVLVDLVPSELRQDAARVFAPNASGTANAVFSLLRGHAMLWIEEDSFPWALTYGDATSLKAAAPAHRRYQRVQEILELSAHESLVTHRSVDILHIADRLLYGPPEYPDRSLGPPTWQDLELEQVGSLRSWDVRPAACHFHITGHPDFGARFSHYLVSAIELDRDVVRKLLAGDLDRTVALSAVPAPVITDGYPTFGTCVAFSDKLPLTPCMAATPIRLFDFSVAALLRAAGEYPIAWAATALTHLRGSSTTSGRGRLAPYVHNEELLWPLLAAMVGLLDETRRVHGEEADRWLDRAGRHIEQRSAVWRPSAEQTGRIWIQRQVDAAWRHSDELIRSYLQELNPAARQRHGRIATHASATGRLRMELRLYGRQLRVWSTVLSAPGARKLTKAAVPILSELLGSDS